KIRAAVDSRQNEATLVIARTDALAVEGFDAAIERALKYAAAGADILFVEALRDEEEMRRAARILSPHAPLLANMVEGGRTPLRTQKELAAMGFSLVIAPGALARAFAFMAEEFLTTLVKDGSTAGYAPRMRSFDEINAMIGLGEMLEAGAAYDASARKAAE
ncbi:MAG: isocitrate lyase/phosphoenolpyruvate mutase family protein, partial [Parvularculaceae bacterium]|nr:isocitrate lyase/phosphoenolpyruvate mutase family protein [Parvularculaceae bacterium]